jgi:hypothetical protein
MIQRDELYVIPTYYMKFLKYDPFDSKLGANGTQWANGLLKKRITCLFCQIVFFIWTTFWILFFLQLVIINAYSCPNTWHVFSSSFLNPSPHSLDKWIHYFFISPHSLQLINSFKIQWNQLAYMDTFCCIESFVFKNDNNVKS